MFIIMIRIINLKLNIINIVKTPFIINNMPRKKKILKPKPDMNVNGEFVNKEPKREVKVLGKQSIKERLKKL